MLINMVDMEGKMRLFKKTLFAVVVVTGAAVATVALPQTATAQGNSERAVESGRNDAYEYVAQPGDSYSVLARKAVQTYGLENQVNLSTSQIIAAETNITLAAKSPLLLQGQNVSISKLVVKEWVENVQRLSRAQQALWQPYTFGVNFDTRQNGE